MTIKNLVSSFNVLYVCILPSAFPCEFVEMHEKWASSDSSQSWMVKYILLS